MEKKCPAPSIANRPHLHILRLIFFVDLSTIQQVEQLTSRDQCLGLQNLNIQTHDSFFNGRQMSMSGGMAVQVFQFQVNFAGFSLFQAGISSLTSCAGETNDYTGCSFQSK